MKTAVIRARCTAELKARVEALAAALGLEEADIVRTAVLDYLNRNEPRGDGPASLTLHAKSPDDTPVTRAAARVVRSAIQRAKGARGL